MPLFKKGSTKGTDYKARLEYKLYLARENPDPVFDLSECDLKSVPSGIYSLCKVFRKESLLLQKNNLTSLSGGGSYDDLSLLQVLDVRKNQLSTLPDEIRLLKNLQELYLNHNLLKSLPESIGELRKLRLLSCSFNKLKKVPDCLGNLKELEELHVEGNPALCVLPNRLSQAKRLSQLIVDVGRYTHPPNEVVLQGTQAVMTFLARELGEEFVEDATDSAEQSQENYNTHLSRLLKREREIQDTLQAMQKRKEEKTQERLAAEKGLTELKEQELKLQNIMRVGKDKLMEDLIKQQSKLAEEVLRFQTRKEADRTKLLEELHKVEESSDQLINQMLALNSSLREPSRIIEQEEHDRRAQEQLFTKHSEKLRRKEVISAMESLLEEERHQRKKMREYEEVKKEVLKSSLSREIEWDEELNQLLCSRAEKQNAVVAAVSADEGAQVAAVATLLERSDAESCRLRAQLVLVERQLGALTAVELQKSTHTLYQLQCDLSEKRTALSNLLVDILNQQKERKKHLLDTLRKMERHRVEEVEEDEDYWLLQYQKLLDSRPIGLLCQGFDPQLVNCIASFSVIHYLPFLARCDLRNLSHQSLKEVGVTSEADRVNILKAVSAYLLDVNSAEPSAPEENMPSAPDACECIVCMSEVLQVIFVPCGHLCCCESCSAKLSECPLCRSNLDRIVRIIQV